ncbi:MAG TPA: SPOR domain-containing protein [Thermoanaerobaculia bacterium]|nr:SPOR domain-containing protein [Thermoanaerobaculia bacterium]
MPKPPPLHLYLAAAPGDMDGERAVLEGLVLPELRARLQGEGIEIVVVDPAQATGEAWDLARRFQEIEGCRIFIGLLGERYGGPPTRVPLSLVLAQPWIAEDPGRSVLEIEILQGALREPGRTTSFFYFRNPRFPSMVPEELRGRFLPESDEAVARLESLKERIRFSGRPVFDGYPCGWSEGLARASRLDTFAEQVFQDLWGAIYDLVRPSAEIALAASAPPPPEPSPAPDPGFDPNATILAFSAAPPLPSSPAPQHRGRKLGFGIAATMALAALGIGLFAFSRQTSTRSTSTPASLAVPGDSGPTGPEPRPSPPDPAAAVITPEAWKRLAAACRLGSDTARALPARAPAGSPMVQVFASTDGIDAVHALSRYSRQHGFLLPQEENGHAICTVVLGPFPSQQAASRAAAELRMSEGTDAKVVPFPGFTK